MSSEVDQLVSKFGGLTEEYKFYNDSVILRYDPAKHVYLLVNEDGSLEVQDGVTSICHIIDKSNALIPWGCKMMSLKALAALEPYQFELGKVEIAWEQLTKIILDAKSAHKETLEEAGNIGKQAHAWIEQFIKWQLSNPPEGSLYPVDYPSEMKAAFCCKAALDWMKQHNVRWISTERKIYSKAFKYAGTADGLCIADSCGNSNCCPTAFKDRLSLPDWKSSNYLYIEYLFQTAAYVQAIQEEDGVGILDRWIIRLGKEDGKFEPWHLTQDTFQDDLDGFLACLTLSRQVRLVEDRMAAHKGKIKASVKLEKEKAKGAALQIKCKNADKYKGIKPPSCGCETCLLKYKKAQEAKGNLPQCHVIY